MGNFQALSELGGEGISILQTRRGPVTPPETKLETPGSQGSSLTIRIELKGALLTAYSMEISLPRALPRIYSKESLHKDLCQ